MTSRAGVNYTEMKHFGIFYLSKEQRRCSHNFITRNVWLSTKHSLLTLRLINHAHLQLLREPEPGRTSLRVHHSGHTRVVAVAVRRFTRRNSDKRSIGQSGAPLLCGWRKGISVSFFADQCVNHCVTYAYQSRCTWPRTVGCAGWRTAPGGRTTHDRRHAGTRRICCTALRRASLWGFPPEFHRSNGPRSWRSGTLRPGMQPEQVDSL